MAPVKNLDPEHDFWHAIASDLRFYRERANLSLADVGKIIDAVRQDVWAFEHGSPKHRLQERHAIALDEYFGLNGHFQRHVKWAKTASLNWRHRHNHYEAGAWAIREFEPLWVPGLLQTEEYAAACFATAGIADPDLAKFIKNRIDRQDIIYRTNPAPTELWMIIDEASISRVVGSPAVMRAQLEHLVKAAERPNISVRVIPLSAGAYLGQDGSLKIMYLTRNERIGYFEAPTGGRLVQDVIEVSDMERRYERISLKALPDTMSRDLILRKVEAI